MKNIGSGGWFTNKETNSLFSTLGFIIKTRGDCNVVIVIPFGIFAVGFFICIGNKPYTIVICLKLRD